MEFCVRMQVHSTCYLGNVAGSVRASVSWLGPPKQFALSVGSSRVARTTTSTPSLCCASSKRSSPVILHKPFLNSGSTEAVPNSERGNGNGSDSGGGGNGGGGNGGDGGEPEPRENHNVFAIALAGVAFFLLQQQAALALLGRSGSGIWEVKGGRWKYLVPHPERDEYVVAAVKNSEEEALAYEEELKVIGEANRGARPQQRHHVQLGLENVVAQFVELGKQLLLPDGYPQSVTDDYMEYTLWRMGQVIASQISGVLTTQALLYAVGLGKGAIPTAAAVNWVLRDGIGYLSKIVLSKYGRHFDVHPKGWRLVSDVIENMSYGLELMTPTFPHLFVYLAAAAGAGRSAAGLIQAATKSCFNAGMAANRNFAEVIAKGEAQGMVSKSVGIALGIAVSAYVGSTGPLLVSTFFGVTALHVFCNLKSYQAVQLRTLNPYRASLVLAEYFRSGNVVSVREVNGEEPIFPKVSFINVRLRGSKGEGVSLSEESKAVAGSIEDHLVLGATFGAAVKTREEADALLDIYKSEHYLLAQRDDRLLVVLKEGATPRDMLRAMMQAVYLDHLKGTGFTSQRNLVHDSGNGGVLRVSHDFMAQQFEQVQQDIGAAGWICEGLIARPAPNRLLESVQASSSALAS